MATQKAEEGLDTFMEAGTFGQLAQGRGLTAWAFEV
jgi:hypothetical protein